MADNRTMAQMLQAPIEGYEDAIVVPPINANNFELKQPLINLVQSNKFTGRQDPHNHLRFFNKVTSTFRHPEVPNTSIKLVLFPFSLDGEARDWLDKEPPRSIFAFSFSLDGEDPRLILAAGGNFLDQDASRGLAIIESKSKVVSHEVVLLIQGVSCYSGFSPTIQSNVSFPSSLRFGRTRDSAFEEFTMNSLFLTLSTSFDDNFKSSNVNPLFEEKDKDVEIKSSTFVTLTSPEENVSIPPGIDLTFPTTLKVSSSNPTSPTLTGEKVWICQISQEINQKRTRERMSDQEAKEIKAEARKIMPQPSTVNCS
ncbi:hypothetical protein Tco_0401816 [Tanacetum coccineum]